MAVHGFVLVTLILNLQKDLSLHFVILIAFTNIWLKFVTWTKSEESYDLSKYAVDLVMVFNGTFVRVQTRLGNRTVDERDYGNLIGCHSNNITS